MSSSSGTGIASSSRQQRRPAVSSSPPSASSSPIPISSARVSRRRPRAVVVVTGSELVRGERTDLNGPFLSRSLLALGLEPARINIVGDDAGELESAIREAVAGAELVAVSGGLGPTHDDRTVEVVARVAGLEL